MGGFMYYITEGKGVGGWDWGKGRGGGGYENTKGVIKTVSSSFQRKKELRTKKRVLFLKQMRVIREDTVASHAHRQLNFFAFFTPIYFIQKNF